MNGHEKSGVAVVAAKRANEAAGPPAEPGDDVVEESVEPRATAEGMRSGKARPGHRAKERVSKALDRVREAARLNKDRKFISLLHHVDVDLLRLSFLALKRDAAAGADGVTWADYLADLEPRLVDLHGRVHRGAYRAQPSRRVYIPKGSRRRGESPMIDSFAGVRCRYDSAQSVRGGETDPSAQAIEPRVRPQAPQSRAQHGSGGAVAALVRGGGRRLGREVPEVGAVVAGGGG